MGEPARTRVFSAGQGRKTDATDAHSIARPAHRHRLDLGGNRVVNSVLHIVHVTQARCHPPARAYLAQRASDKTKRELRRAHKRQLANVIIRHIWKDADRLTHPAPDPLPAAA